MEKAIHTDRPSYTIRELIPLVNRLIVKGLVIKVFGLPYEPFSETLAITDVRIIRQNFFQTTSNIVLDGVVSVSKMKMRTLTGYSPLFNRLVDKEGKVKYECLYRESNLSRVMIRDLDNACQGMIFRSAKATGLIVDLRNSEDNKKEIDVLDIPSNIVTTVVVNPSDCDSLYQIEDLVTP
jgi:hypothetical protein